MSPKRGAAFLLLSLASTAVFLAYARPDLQLALPRVTRGPTDKKLIALTFDDAPHPLTTPLLLKALAQTGTRATFFLVGENVKRYPDLAARIVAGGHEIGNHSYSHPRLQFLSPAAAKEELDRADAILRRLTGRPPRFFRPPGGGFSTGVLALAAQHHYTLALWSNNPGDYLIPTADGIVTRVLRKLRPGEVVLLHDAGPQTAEALTRIIPEARSRRYQFVTLSELVDAPKYRLVGVP